MNTTWKSLVIFSDTISAQALVERLHAEGVPALLKSDSPIFGIARTCEVCVPGEFLPRARWLLSLGEFSESELAYLATGELPERTE